jgi:hypothetical protein
LNKDVYRPEKEIPYVIGIYIPIVNDKELLNLGVLK